MCINFICMRSWFRSKSLIENFYIPLRTYLWYNLHLFDVNFSIWLILPTHSSLFHWINSTSSTTHLSYEITYLDWKRLLYLLNSKRKKKKKIETPMILIRSQLPWKSSEREKKEVRQIRNLLLWVITNYKYWHGINTLLCN